VRKSADRFEGVRADRARGVVPLALPAIVAHVVEDLDHGVAIAGAPQAHLPPLHREFRKKDGAHWRGPVCGLTEGSL
jgi:hypothetical protein